MGEWHLATSQNWKEKRWLQMTYSVIPNYIIFENFMLLLLLICQILQKHIGHDTGANQYFVKDFLFISNMAII
jgi:hypothetical protein